jgi:hypothetical protein
MKRIAAECHVKQAVANDGRASADIDITSRRALATLSGSVVE